MSVRLKAIGKSSAHGAFGIVTVPFMGKQAGRAYVVLRRIVCPCFCALFFLLFSFVGEAKGTAKTAVGGASSSPTAWGPTSRWSHNSNHELLAQRDPMQQHATEESEVSLAKRHLRSAPLFFSAAPCRAVFVRLHVTRVLPPLYMKLHANEHLCPQASPMETGATAPPDIASGELTTAAETCFCHGS